MAGWVSEMAGGAGGGLNGSAGPLPSLPINPSFMIALNSIRFKVQMPIGTAGINSGHILQVCEDISEEHGSRLGRRMYP
jgi:hypothetical protein